MKDKTYSRIVCWVLYAACVVMVIIAAIVNGVK